MSSAEAPPPTGKAGAPKAPKAAAPKAAPKAADKAPDADSANKRGPGRPPKKLPMALLANHGVVGAPDDPDNRLEFVYRDPGAFKAMFSYFKTLRARDIHIRCTPRGLTFFTRNVSGACRTVAEYPGALMNHFYCEGSFWLGLNREAVDKVFASIDKSFYKITFLYRHDDTENVSVIFKDAEIDKECNYKLGICRFDADDGLVEAEAAIGPDVLAAYPLALTLSAKQFKKTVADVAAYSDVLFIEKLGAHPFQFTYVQTNIAFQEVYRNPELIRLHSTVPADDMFRTHVLVANVASLASAMVAKDVRIYCDQVRDLVFRSEIDALVMTSLVALG